jgi:hypothetical protein
MGRSLFWYSFTLRLKLFLLLRKRKSNKKDKIKIGRMRERNEAEEDKTKIVVEGTTDEGEREFQRSLNCWRWRMKKQFRWTLKGMP